MSGPEGVQNTEDFHTKMRLLKNRLEQIYGNTPAWSLNIAGHAADALIMQAPGKQSKDFSDGELRDAYRAASKA